MRIFFVKIHFEFAKKTNSLSQNFRQIESRLSVQKEKENQTMFQRFICSCWVKTLLENWKLSFSILTHFFWEWNSNRKFTADYIIFWKIFSQHYSTFENYKTSMKKKCEKCQLFYQKRLPQPPKCLQLKNQTRKI